ncbi:MAG TPA: 2'-5' RNA ligase family protein [Gaiellaceae bacterium]|jgi:2'-5' RNA ligase|nr:2'-5' RNA ligase family protein [Gaiellaceae bacterium]
MSLARVAGSDRLRLFCALQLPDSTVGPVRRWQERELHSGRIVPPENLHFTLAFLGFQAAADVGAIGAALRDAAGEAGGLRLVCRGYRETRSVGMLVFDDESGRAGALAGRLHGALEELGLYRREARAWLPHLTVLRFRERPRLEPRPPELGEIVPSDAAVFISRLRPGGAQYEILESVPLGGR